MRKEEKKHLSQLYNKLDAVQKRNTTKAPVSVETSLLQQIEHQYQILLKEAPNTPEYMLHYDQLLNYAYEYYQVREELPVEFLPEGLTLTQIIKTYHQAHKDSFNEEIQQSIHSYLVYAVNLLKQLDQAPQIGPTVDQYAALRTGFAQQLARLLHDGFALDLRVYHQEIERPWLVIKQARQLVADDFRPLVGVLDRYSRLEVPNQKKRPKFKEPDVNTSPTTAFTLVDSNDGSSHSGTAEFQQSSVAVVDEPVEQATSSSHSDAAGNDHKRSFKVPKVKRKNGHLKFTQDAQSGKLTVELPNRKQKSDNN